MAQPTISEGANGTAVRTLQVLLTRKGFAVTADGVFGPKTLTAVRRFQARLGLAVDGVVGPRTWAALQAGTKPPPVTPTHTGGLSSYTMADIARAWAVAGHPYLWDGKAVPLSISNPHALDCSGLVEWAVAHATGGQHWVAGSKYQAAATNRVSVSQGIRTKGALLFISSNGRYSGVHHVAVSMGDGRTAEARSSHTSPNCGSFSASGRFNLAGLVPVLRY